MARITNHDVAYAARTAAEPNARTVSRVAGRGFLNSLTEGNELWYNDDTTLSTGTIPITAGFTRHKRAGR